MCRKVTSASDPVWGFDSSGPSEEEGAGGARGWPVHGRPVKGLWSPLLGGREVTAASAALPCEEGGCGATES